MSSKEFLKIVNIVGDLYHEDPEMFKIKFRGFYADLKLHNKIKKVCKGDKKAINHLYKALNKFDWYVKKYKNKYDSVRYDYIYENVSEEFDIPEKLLKSAIASRNSYKRDQLN